MSKDLTTTETSTEGSAGLGSFEEKIREFQGNLKNLVNVQNLDELKTKWEEISTQTREEIQEHPLQMIAMGGMLGFSLGLVGKDINVKQVSSRVVDWAAKLGAAWAVEKFNDRGTKGSDQSVH